MLHEIEDDLIFGNLAYYSIKADVREARDFKKVALGDRFPDEYVFDSLQCKVKICKSRMEFRILERKYYTKEQIMRGYPSKIDVDLGTMMAFKIAKLAGFNVFLDPKYSN